MCPDRTPLHFHGITNDPERALFPRTFLPRLPKVALPYSTEQVKWLDDFWRPRLADYADSWGDYDCIWLGHYVGQQVLGTDVFGLLNGVPDDFVRQPSVGWVHQACTKVEALQVGWFDASFECYRRGSASDGSRARAKETRRKSERKEGEVRREKCY